MFSATFFYPFKWQRLSYLRLTISDTTYYLYQAVTLPTPLYLLLLLQALPNYHRVVNTGAFSLKFPKPSGNLYSASLSIAGS